MAEELAKVTPITKTRFKVGDDKIYERVTKSKGTLSAYEDLFSLRITKDMVVDGQLYKNAVTDGMGNIVDWGEISAASLMSEDKKEVAAPEKAKAKKAVKASRK